MIQLLGDEAPTPSTGASPLDPTGGLPSPRPLILVPFCQIIGVGMVSKVGRLKYGLWSRKRKAPTRAAAKPRWGGCGRELHPLPPRGSGDITPPTLLIHPPQHVF